MILAAIGGSVDDPENERFLTIGSALDQPLYTGPLTGEQREDLQLRSAVDALTTNQVIQQPLAFRWNDEDPPDVYVSSETREWGLELTELTIQDLRVELADVRRFGRRLRERLMARETDFAHLRGLLVTLSTLPGVPLPKRQEALLDQIESALEQDRGYVGEGQLSHGVPKQLNRRGFYGNMGSFNVIVQRWPLEELAGKITVSAHSSSTITQSEAIAALGKRIKDKDREGNELLLVTCGLVDNQGYACPADLAIFELLKKAAAAGKPIFPKGLAHIRNVLIHQWNTPWILAWEKDDDVPWISNTILKELRAQQGLDPLTGCATQVPGAEGAPMEEGEH